ncbi:hypothetical protein SAMN02990966_07994 [Rhodospirillales bacterium URHD0017]|jgi:hypothetical protein|nr:hypothetical protein SAMN02990966_07994 [Rhodospirillales bacterium URHD0017]
MKAFGLTRPVLRFGPSVFPAGWAFYFAIPNKGRTLEEMTT